jgi:ribonuclease HI
MISPTHEIITLSYKMELETTNNIAEYEALVLRLRVLGPRYDQFYDVY